MVVKARFPADCVATVTNEMTPSNHQHTAVTTHVLRQRQGVPYELERTVCRDCKKLLSERQVRRAAT